MTLIAVTPTWLFLACTVGTDLVPAALAASSAAVLVGPADTPTVLWFITLGPD